MQLPPCHYAFQFYVEDGKLSCKFEMRSVDLFLGLPFDIALYALLTHMVAQVCGLEVGELIGSFGDTHIYTNHIEQVKIQLEREPYPLPKLHLNPTIDNIDEFTYGNINILYYAHHPKLKGKVAK
ncbi:Thymidylate synthase [compost metagenome]